MDNALTPALLPGAARPGPDGLMARLTAVPVKAMVMLTLGVAALAAVLAALAMWSKSGDYRVLYANLSDKDGGADPRAAVADERALQACRRRQRDPGAGRTRCTTCA